MLEGCEGQEGQVTEESSNQVSLDLKQCTLDFNLFHRSLWS